MSAPGAPNDFDSAVAYLRQLDRFGIELGLERVRAVAERLGNPQTRYPAILVAGTNGKGSVCAMLSAILEQAGYRAGLYTSPHLVRETERIRIAGKDISREAFAGSAGRVWEATRAVAAGRARGRSLLTAFETFTLMAFDAFDRAEIEIAVVEVGMGGRLDATNICEPIVTVITPVDLDHQEFLGDTYEAIAAEKAGIVREKTPVISGARKHEVRTVLEGVAASKRAPYFQGGKDFDFLPLRDGLMHYAGMRASWRDLAVGLSGMHQLANSATACAVVEALLSEGFRISEESVRKGLAAVRWRGRLETLSTEPLVICDGAHNPDGARTLRRYLEQYVPFRKIHLACGLKADKDAEAIFSVLAPVAARITLTATADGTLVDPAKIEPAVRRIHDNVVVEPDLGQVLARVYWRKPSDEMTVICGSLYLVGEAIRRLEDGEIPGFVPAGPAA